MNIDKCAIIGFGFKDGELKPISGTTIEYETYYVGKVRITLTAYQELLSGAYERYIIAGICKHRTINDEEPLLIDSNFIREGYKKYMPISFEEKCSQCLKALYQLYGKENIEFELRADRHFPLGYADPEEFVRIIDQLKSDINISYRSVKKMSRNAGSELYMGVKVTNLGKDEAKKQLPQMPLFGLVNQSITTGDKETDDKINHSRELFLSKPQTMDKMRSACEALSFVLEPLRDDLKSYFTTKDVSDFFQIVNTFDIRHNKDATRNLVEPEQLEWVYYTLLNTISTYIKLKNKHL